MLNSGQIDAIGGEEYKGTAPPALDIHGRHVGRPNSSPMPNGRESTGSQREALQTVCENIHTTFILSQTNAEALSGATIESLIKQVNHISPAHRQRLLAEYVVSQIPKFDLKTQSAKEYLCFIQHLQKLPPEQYLLLQMWLLTFIPDNIDSSTNLDAAIANWWANCIDLLTNDKTQNASLLSSTLDPTSPRRRTPHRLNYSLNSPETPAYAESTRLLDASYEDSQNDTMDSIDFTREGHSELLSAAFKNHLIVLLRQFTRPKWLETKFEIHADKGKVSLSKVTGDKSRLAGLFHSARLRTKTQQSELNALGLIVSFNPNAYASPTCQWPSTHDSKQLEKNRQNPIIQALVHEYFSCFHPIASFLYLNSAPCTLFPTNTGCSKAEKAELRRFNTEFKTAKYLIEDRDNIEYKLNPAEETNRTLPKKLNFNGVLTNKQLVTIVGYIEGIVSATSPIVKEHHPSSNHQLAIEQIRRALALKLEVVVVPKRQGGFSKFSSAKRELLLKHFKENVTHVDFTGIIRQAVYNGPDISQTTLDLFNLLLAAAEEKLKTVPTDIDINTVEAAITQAERSLKSVLGWLQPLITNAQLPRMQDLKLPANVTKKVHAHLAQHLLNKSYQRSAMAGFSPANYRSPMPINWSKKKLLYTDARQKSWFSWQSNPFDTVPLPTLPIPSNGNSARLAAQSLNALLETILNPSSSSFVLLDMAEHTRKKSLAPLRLMLVSFSKRYFQAKSPFPVLLAFFWCGAGYRRRLKNAIAHERLKNRMSQEMTSWLEQLSHYVEKLIYGYFFSLGAFFMFNIPVIQRTDFNHAFAKYGGWPAFILMFSLPFLGFIFDRLQHFTYSLLDTSCCLHKLGQRKNDPSSSKAELDETIHKHIQRASKRDKHIKKRFHQSHFKTCLLNWRKVFDTTLTLGFMIGAYLIIDYLMDLKAIAKCHSIAEHRPTCWPLACTEAGYPQPSAPTPLPYCDSDALFKQMFSSQPIVAILLETLPISSAAILFLTVRAVLYCRARHLATQPYQSANRELNQPLLQSGP